MHDHENIREDEHPEIVARNDLRMLVLTDVLMIMHKTDKGWDVKRSAPPYTSPHRTGSDGTEKRGESL